MSGSQTSKPSVVLVHGAWGDGSGWRKVIPLLMASGIRVHAVQNPTTSLAEDVKATRRILDIVDGPVVLVGHSWGGTVITEAGNDPKVAALVYVAAFAPNAGQSTGDQVAAFPAPPGLGQVSADALGGYWMSRNGWVTCVAQDLPEDEAATLFALQPPLGSTTFSDTVTKAAWADLPNWYVISQNDRAVSVELQHHLASVLNARTTTLDASHMSLLSKPDAVAAVILEAVAEVCATVGAAGDTLIGSPS
ncbi:Pimeloyl-ACP methyl ester carboxylesterase [Rhizobium sp. RU35A]|uniref:alpha/beta fold hydrolase n=1 Tax=Rhizobium sp. RU35A TaxID=1907414 RepID=UPI00095455E3|nr:alpha/beta hydrolase [Rhizobium sp. RU35A]SIQ86328.1 Pimeloyl-ACP methyl ester carboxylesterase [Rhizobium sp. RU35A]